MQSSRNFVKVHCFVLDVFSVAKPVSFAAQSLPEIFQVRITVYYSKYTLRQGKKPAKNPTKNNSKTPSETNKKPQPTKKPPDSFKISTLLSVYLHLNQLVFTQILILFGLLW